MSTMQNDPLYPIFEQHLHSGLYDAMPTEIFVRDVVDYYFMDLSRQGHIPHQMIELLKTDLAQDVQEMLKRKIYGHFGIGEYNRTRRGGKSA